MTRGEQAMGVVAQPPRPALRRLRPQQSINEKCDRAARMGCEADVETKMESGFSNDKPISGTGGFGVFLGDQPGL
jgi:hypothetical protein